MALYKPGLIRHMSGGIALSHDHYGPIRTVRGNDCFVWLTFAGLMNGMRTAIPDGGRFRLLPFWAGTTVGRDAPKLVRGRRLPGQRVRCGTEPGKDEGDVAVRHVRYAGNVQVLLDAQFTVNRSDFGLTWSPMGMARMDKTRPS